MDPLATRQTPHTRLAQVPANPSPPKLCGCTESLLPGSLVTWLTPPRPLQDTKKTVSTTKVWHPPRPMLCMHRDALSASGQKGAPPEPAVDSGPPAGRLGSAPKVLFHRSRGGRGCPVLSGRSPAFPASCSSEEPLTQPACASHPESPRSSGGGSRSRQRPRQAGHVPSTLVASKNKKKNRVSGTSPFTSAGRDVLPTSRHKGGSWGRMGRKATVALAGLRQVAGRGSVRGGGRRARDLRRTPRGTGCGSPSPSAAPSSASPRAGGWSS